MDPFLDLIHLLRPQATLWGRTDGVGRWGVSFRKRDDLLFCWVQQGECQLIRPLGAPVHLAPDDFVLIRTSMPFTLTTDPAVEPEDSETLVAATMDTDLKLGEGTDSPVILRGGRFVFDTANEGLLTGLLPSLVHIAAGDTSSWRVRSLLKMNEAEYLQPGPGSEFVIARLMELILVEILRSEALRANPEQGPEQSQEHTGLLAGLTDPVTARALAAMHREVAHGWTVAGLARLCGVSRSSFAVRFRRIVGRGPIEYLLDWRMALAKDELRGGTRSIGEVALMVGFQSSSAFSTAFTRAVGCSPKRFAASALALTR
ncbi:AraC family transcriptional regulator [Tunturibacter empetritectus]|uniref:AraC-like DNA-binding protein n=1 Tax=Tunturiibacter lichenicola TaxID=2051959 RepID=A0A7W8J9N5_9BACT|nr:AraC family transcriptional regulator [Edaphobacter lichenicola]MBB5343889.1 AraC-like DNA-binding protein [Edaphobacter lichenicola]